MSVTQSCKRLQMSENPFFQLKILKKQCLLFLKTQSYCFVKCKQYSITFFGIFSCCIVKWKQYFGLFVVLLVLYAERNGKNVNSATHFLIYRLVWRKAKKIFICILLWNINSTYLFFCCGVVDAVPRATATARMLIPELRLQRQEAHAQIFPPHCLIVHFSFLF